MCIRDSIDIVKGNRKMAAFVHPMVGGEIVQNEGYETKSYAPPLDVYKRQEQAAFPALCEAGTLAAAAQKRISKIILTFCANGAGMLIWASLWQRVPSRPCAPTSVSYTHLDVYKRQI